MLSAVLNGKKRGSGFAGKKLELGETDGAEDLITATVFERIAYLPNFVFESFMNELLELEEPVGELEQVLFWPSWYLADQRIEPDVVLICSNRIVIVEAKRYDNVDQQFPKQLANELRAGWSEDVLRQNPVLLAVGGIADQSDYGKNELFKQLVDELPDDCPDFAFESRSWRQVFDALQASIDSNVNDDLNDALRRLLADVVSAFMWHGIRVLPHRNLADIRPHAVSSSSFPFLSFKRGISVKQNIASSYRPLASLTPTFLTYTHYPITSGARL